MIHPDDLDRMRAAVAEGRSLNHVEAKALLQDFDRYRAALFAIDDYGGIHGGAWCVEMADDALYPDVRAAFAGTPEHLQPKGGRDA